jgi:hypothetical protein
LNLITAQKQQKMSAEDIKKYEFNKGQSGNPTGRPKGARNRSTILRELLDVNDQELKMHQAQIDKAIEQKDTNAYKAVLDSAYGAPTQQIEQTQTNVDLTGLTSDDIRQLLKGE